MHMRSNGAAIEAQFARRPPPSRRPAEVPLTTAALGWLTRPLHGALTPPLRAEGERLNRLLMLM
jgi:hypothetical protein